MTMLKAARFNIRRDGQATGDTGGDTAHVTGEAGASSSDSPAARARARVAQDAAARPPAGAFNGPGSDTDMLFDNQEDGFAFDPLPNSAGADRMAAAASEGTETPPETPPPLDRKTRAELALIRKEGLTGRQLRMARRIAAEHNLPAFSDFDAVRLLRQAGIDPFERASLLDIAAMPDPATPGAAGPGSASAGAASAELPGSGLPRLPVPHSNSALPGDAVRLPQTIKPIQLPSTEQRAEVNHAAEILTMQRDIARRRRRKLTMLMARMFLFVLLPTIIAGVYFSSIATPLFGTKSESSIKMATTPAAGAAGGLLTGTALATSPDSIAVQGYLQSRDAMMRLDADSGFRSHFQGPEIDPLLRLSADATMDDAYRLYQRFLNISYDPAEGIIRMEVIAPTPQLSQTWSLQLIKYAEEQVDQLTRRLREDAMTGARQSYTEAEAAMIASQTRVVELQERYKILSSETEAALLTQQIGALESQLVQERLSLAQMEANSNPNSARMEPVKRRIASLETEVAEHRRRLTESGVGGESLARIQGELMVAQADVTTRQMILAQSLQSMENARIEADRQSRYLVTSVAPVPPDRATYPRVFENTAVTLLICLGIYLMISMTVAILREQVSA